MRSSFPGLPISLLATAALCGSAAPNSTAPVEPWVAPAWEAYLRAGPTDGNLPEFSRAGYRGALVPIPRPAVTVSVLEFGARPDDGADDRAAIQTAIDAVEKRGGGVVYFPAGRYDLNSEPIAEAARQPDASAHGIVVRKSGVVLRGASSSPQGSVLHQHHAPLVGGSNGGPYALVRFVGSGATGEREARLVADVRRGESVLPVDSSAGFVAGQVVRLSLTDPRIDPDDPRAADADLTRSLVEPFVLRDDLRDYLIRGTNGQCALLLEIEAVPDATHIRLRQALRLDLATRWSPRLTGVATLSEVGIEDLRFECDWPGGYAHHKPFPLDAGGHYVNGGPGVVRTANEQNYAWSALSFTHVANGWMRDLAFWNYTQDITASFCRALTIESVAILGQKGHTGITFTRTHDCLVRDVTIAAPRVHTFFVSGYASGNVFTRSRFEYGPFDPVSSCDTCLDFHGIAPFENLYDGLVNAYVYPGGALSYLPHAGQRNVFWNIAAPPHMLRGGDSPEFFRTFARTSSGTPASAHEHWPKSFVIGVHRDGPPITIAGSSADRADAWLTVQGLNRRGVQPASLYEAQVARARGPAAPAGVSGEPTNAAEAAARQAQEDELIRLAYDRKKAGLSPARQAWESILEANLGSFYLPIHRNNFVKGVSTAWDFVDDDPRLPRVLLIGDSISRGYTVPVRAALAAVANVHRAPENCGPTANGLKKLDLWLGDGRWDVIHFNFGIHDRATPEAEYEARLEQLTQRLLATGARLVWASSTPLPAVSKYGSDEAMVVRNAIARRVMERHRITIDDLYTAIHPRLAELQLPNDVHFSAEGYAFLGEQVALAIRARLPPSGPRESGVPQPVERLDAGPPGG